MTIIFSPSGRGKAQCPPNPEYPNGIAMDLTAGREPACAVTLPYPAPECGLWLIECELCGMRAAVSAAGRPDDPVSVKVRCNLEPDPGKPQ